MTETREYPMTIPGNTDPAWNELYRLGGIAAIVSVIVMILSVGAFIVWPNAPGVTSTLDMLTLTQENTAAGLTALDLGVSVSNLFSILLYLALYVALRSVNQSYALVALAFGLVAVASAIAARPVLEIFTLGDLYARAPSELEANRYLAAGETLLVLFHGTAFRTYILLGGISLLISSWLMLQSNLFGKAAAYLGILGNSAAIGFVLPVVGPFFAFLSMLLLAIWFILLAQGFFRLAHRS